MVRERESNAGEAHFPVPLTVIPVCFVSLPEQMGSCSRHRLKISCGCNVQIFRMFAEADSQTGLSINQGEYFVNEIFLE